MTESPEASCLNCQAVLTGPYCAQCGQKVESRLLPFGQLVLDFLGDTLTFDARVFRTLKPLFVKPGHLTREYVTGRRVRYVPPLRLYIVTSLVLFAAMSTVLPRAVNDALEGRDRDALVAQMHREAKSPDKGLLVGVLVGQENNARLEEQWTKWAEQFIRHPRLAASAAVQRLSYFMLMMLPVFAGLLKLFYRNSYYAVHFIFSLHGHAALYTGLTAVVLTSGVHGMAGVIALSVLFFWAPVYLGIALQEMFQGSRILTVLKSCLLTGLYSIILLFSSFFYLLFVLGVEVIMT